MNQVSPEERQFGESEPREISEVSCPSFSQAVKFGSYLKEDPLYVSGALRWPQQVLQLFVKTTLVTTKQC